MITCQIDDSNELLNNNLLRGLMIQYARIAAETLSMLTVVMYRMFS